MVFPSMLYGIAFGSGCLLTLAVMLSIHRRAARRTTQRIGAMAPVSAVDIRAERDRSRAQFAGAVRHLEASVEKLRTKCTSQSAGVGRQAAEIDRLEAEIEKRTSQSAEVRRQSAEIARLEAELKTRVGRSAELARQAPELRRLEAALQKCASQSAEIGRQAVEIQRLESELKKRAALISVLRVRGQAQHAVT